MTDTKHTPEPWILQDWGHDHYEIHDSDGETIAEIPVYKIDNLQTEPNARLVRAAPELLEALNSLANEVQASMSLGEQSLRESCGNTNVACLLNRLHEAEAAIAKAVQS